MYFLWAEKNSFLAGLVIYKKQKEELSHMQWKQSIGLKAEIH